MTSVAAGLFSSLPKPKYTGENEELPAHTQQKGPRIVGPGVLNEAQIVLKVSRVVPPPYPQPHMVLSRVTAEFSSSEIWPTIIR
jgi:SNW domain-containing protein 1